MSVTVSDVHKTTTQDHSTRDQDQELEAMVETKANSSSMCKHNPHVFQWFRSKLHYCDLVCDQVLSKIVTDR